MQESFIYLFIYLFFLFFVTNSKNSGTLEQYLTSWRIVQAFSQRESYAGIHKN